MDIATRMLLMDGGKFAPSSLFKANEEGVWYDPSDLTTLFQDAAGTIPVTAVEQPVGLMLDKSKGLVLGSELVDTLNTAAAWGVYGTNTVVDDSGAVKITYVDNASGAYAYFAQANGLSQNLVVGKRYVVSGEAKVSSGSVNVTVPVSVGGTATVTNTSYTSFSIQFICTNVSGDFLRADSMGVGEVIWLRNISVRELPGNHAYQATSANRPTLSARYNLLKYSEQITSAPWVAYNGSNGTALSPIIAPDGTTTAIGLNDTSASGYYGVTQNVDFSSNTVTTFSIYVKQGTNTTGFSIWLIGSGSNNYFQGTISWVDGVPVKSGWNVSSHGNSWYRISFAFNSGASTSVAIYLLPCPTVPSEIGSTYFWGADLRPSNHGTDLPPYQRVTTNTDYDTVGFPPYLAFNGTSSGMVTNSIDFSATDKMSVWAGVRKLSDASIRSLFVFGTSGWVAGSFEWLFPPNLSSIRLECAYVGDSGVAGNYMQVDTEQAPASSVIHTSIVSNLRPYWGGVNIRYNGELKPSVQQNNVETSGNFGNFALTIGGRQTTLLFLGNIYSLIIRGAQSTDKQVSNAESWINKKIGKVY